MSSIIEGYNYDIFISYRQKDNKHDGWVTEFVDNLKGELESTFKEEVSVYFDINPHDGLLETHDVDESLKEKLKCLIFIPIISRTYCDPKSFAWEHEFKAFIEKASKDHSGLKIKLSGGNIGTRILPVQIHELESEDKKLVEKELGGFLRGVEFIYREPGVNRPLRANEEHPDNNLNKTIYRNQINKVANAVKDIISSLSKLELPEEKKSMEFRRAEPERLKNSRATFILLTVSLLLLLIIGLITIPKLLKTTINPDKTIAVLPFRNLSNDTTQFCDGFMEELLSNLQKVKSLTVRSRTSSDQYRDSKKTITTIGNELNVNYLIQGSIGQEGKKLKVWVQLIDSKADKQIWTNEYLREMTMEQIFALQSEISEEIAAELKAVLSSEEKERIEKRPTENLEAFNYYLQGNFYYWKGYASQDYESAIILYEKAVELDPKFAIAYTRIAICLMNQYWFYEKRNNEILLKSKKVIDKAFEIDPDLPEAHLALAEYYYRGYLQYEKALEQLEIVLKEQPGNSEAYYVSASVNRRAGKWKISKDQYLKAFELDPRSSRIAFNTGQTFDLLRDYPRTQNFYEIANMLQPDWVYPYHELARLFLRWNGDTKKAREMTENAVHYNRSLISDSLIIETNVIINIYEGKYEEALLELSTYKYILFQTQYYYRPKHFYYARIYSLINRHDLEYAYYDSARVFLEKEVNFLADDPRLYSSLGIAYAGLGQENKAINFCQKAVKMLPVEREAWKGIYLVEDMAQTYVMLGKSEEALKQLEYLLSIPGNLTTKILEIDPRWAPLKDLPEYKKMIEKYSSN